LLTFKKQAQEKYTSVPKILKFLITAKYQQTLSTPEKIFIWMVP